MNRGRPLTWTNRCSKRWRASVLPDRYRALTASSCPWRLPIMGADRVVPWEQMASPRTSKGEVPAGLPFGTGASVP
jgi:hypothetical protein